MSSKLAASILDEIVADLKSQGVTIGAELRDRLEPLALAGADLALRALAGEDVSEQRKVLEARALNLEAAGIIGAARIAAEATRNAVFGFLKLGFDTLLEITT